MKHLALILLLGLLAFGCHDGDGDPDTAATSGGDTGPVGTDTSQPGDDTSSPGSDVMATVDTCDVDTDCDDGVSCTVDRCVDASHGRACEWTVAAGACLINAVCRTAGDTVGCLTCDPAAPTVWTPLADGTACDDGQLCSVDPVCAAGVCGGQPKACDDGDACTMDFCDPETGECQNLAAGAGCDDGDACTEDDQCDANTGACVGSAVSCDDGNPCTDDACDPTDGCTAEPNSAACSLDDDACTAEQCVDGACTSVGATDCDDENSCTLDTCDVDFGCYSVPFNSPCCVGDSSLCDDGNPCTDDLCDDLTGGCTWADNTASCDDGEVCTTGDACAAGECSGGPLSCDDANPCTDDVCEPGVGCVSTPNSTGACDDGLDCSTEDTCVAGACVGDTSGCTCIPSFSPVASKVTTLALGDGGVIGQGVDVDEDPETCAPATNCSDGINNSLGVIGSLVNDAIAGAVASGSLQLIIEHRDFVADGSPYELTLYQADSASPACVDGEAICDYSIASLYDTDTCTPQVLLPASLSTTGGVTTLKAGGKGTVVPFEIPFSEGASLAITLFDVQVIATVTLADGKVALLSGVLGGAVPKDELKAAVAQLPADALPVPPEQIAPLLDALVVSDIDTTGDGQLNAASIGITLDAVAANIVGVSP